MRALDERWSQLGKWLKNWDCDWILRNSRLDLRESSEKHLGAFTERKMVTVFVAPALSLWQPGCALVDLHKKKRELCNYRGPDLACRSRTSSQIFLQVASVETLVLDYCQCHLVSAANGPMFEFFSAPAIKTLTPTTCWRLWRQLGAVVFWYSRLQPRGNGGPKSN